MAGASHLLAAGVLSAKTYAENNCRTIVLTTNRLQTLVER